MHISLVSEGDKREHERKMGAVGIQLAESPIGNVVSNGTSSWTRSDGETALTPNMDGGGLRISSAEVGSSANLLKVY